MSEKRFVGYHEESTLPVKRGDTVTIKKGTVIRSMGPEREKIAARTYKVKVAHVLPGMDAHTNYHGEAVAAVSPSVEWVGTGGYWHTASINDIPEAQS